MPAPAARMLVKFKRRSGTKKKQVAPQTAPARLLRRRPMPTSSAPMTSPGGPA